MQWERASEKFHIMAELVERINANFAQYGGRPCIRGMRIRVVDVLDLLAARLTQQ